MTAFALFALLAASAMASDADICRGNDRDLDELIAVCSRVIASRASTHDEVSSAYIDRGQHHYQKMEYDLAIADFDQAISMKAKWLQLAYEDRGNVYFARGEDQLAIESYTKALELYPNYPGAYTARGLLYEKAGETDKARADYQSALTVADSHFSDDGWARQTARERLDKLKTK